MGRKNRVSTPYDLLTSLACSGDPSAFIAILGENPRLLYQHVRAQYNTMAECQAQLCSFYGRLFADFSRNPVGVESIASWHEDASRKAFGQRGVTGEVVHGAPRELEGELAGFMRRLYRFIGQESKRMRHARSPFARMRFDRSLVLIILITASVAVMIFGWFFLDTWFRKTGSFLEIHTGLFKRQSSSIRVLGLPRSAVPVQTMSDSSDLQGSIDSLFLGAHRDTLVGASQPNTDKATQKKTHTIIDTSSKKTASRVRSVSKAALPKRSSQPDLDALPLLNSPADSATLKSEHSYDLSPTEGGQMRRLGSDTALVPR